MTIPYTYLFCDLLNFGVIDELPLIKVGFDSTFNAHGQLKGELDLADSDVQNLNWYNATIPAKTALFVDRGGSLVWGGVIWTRDFADNNVALSIQANEFTSYLQAYRLFTDNVWTNRDQYALVRDLIAYMNFFGNVPPITVIPQSPIISGILRTFTVFGYELKKVSDVLDQLMKYQDGIDYTTTVQYDINRRPSVNLVVSYPKIGRLATASGLVFEKPGNIVGYKYKEDGTKGPITTMWAAGAGSGNLALETSANNSLPGYPNLHDVVSHTDIRDAVTLASYAQADAALRTTPVTLVDLTVRADQDPVLGSWQEGDWARVRILDERFPAPGLDAALRIIKTGITVGDDGGETVVLTMATS